MARAVLLYRHINPASMLDIRVRYKLGKGRWTSEDRPRLHPRKLNEKERLDRARRGLL